MEMDIIISGFGGQGVLFAGQLLAYAAMDAGKEVTWYPSYGPEMRGGTANVTVVFSDEEIGAPVVKYPQAAIILNNPSMTKYEPLIKPGGWLIYNSSIIDIIPTRKDIKIVPVPATDIALELGDQQISNMVILGALIAGTEALPVEAVLSSMDEHMARLKRDVIIKNKEALMRGVMLVRTPA